MHSTNNTTDAEKKHSRIYVAGHRGLVGRALVRRLQTAGYDNLLLASHEDLDLRNQAAVRAFFAESLPDYVYLAAARVGGILDNSRYPADYLYDNLMIQANVIEAAYATGVTKLLALGSTCVYPRMAPQPISEDALLTGALEPTNEWYAIAKISGIKLCQAYRKQYRSRFVAAMPTNLYGPGDNFDPEASHVIPALIRRIHQAKIDELDCVTIWGTGTPLREFLFVDDAAAACSFLMDTYDGDEPINVGCGEEVTIHSLAEKIADIVGFEGRIEFDSSKPDGTPRKLADSTKIRALGWSPTVTLDDGIRRTYNWYLAHRAQAPGFKDSRAP